MQFEAANDNAFVIAKYLKANPNTKLVEVADNPAENAIITWQPGRFMIALYENEKALKNVKVRNYFVLPLERSKFTQINLAEFTIFESDDKSWKSTFPALAVELETYNAATKQAAQTVGKAASTEKFIAYKYDTALAQLIGNILPQKVGIVGFVLAALLGAVVSSLAAMLNAASTIFSMDIFKRHLSRKASQNSVVFIGRICVVVFTFIAIMLAPQLGNPKISNSIFTIIQEGQGFISPGILAVFVFGFIIRKAPPAAGVLGLLTNIVAYGALKVAVPSIQFLNRMAICFALCLLVMTIITLIKPLAKPIEFKKNTTIELKTSKGAVICGLIVVVITLAFYVIFSPIGIAK
jgi:solute:Na+ symporter, SSS family